MGGSFRGFLYFLPPGKVQLPERICLKTDPTHFIFRAFLVAKEVSEKLKFLSFRGALRAEESPFSCDKTRERFLTSFGMTK